jgi:hypothetical protein
LTSSKTNLVLKRFVWLKNWLTIFCVYNALLSKGSQTSPKLILWNSDSHRVLMIVPESEKLKKDIIHKRLAKWWSRLRLRVRSSWMQISYIGLFTIVNIPLWPESPLIIDDWCLKRKEKIQKLRAFSYYKFCFLSSIFI